MGVNANKHAREHRRSQPDWPIHVQYDPLGTYRIFGRKFEFRWPYNDTGWIFINLWGLHIWIRPEYMMARSEVIRLRPFRQARWIKKMIAERVIKRPAEKADVKTGSRGDL